MMDAAVDKATTYWTCKTNIVSQYWHIPYIFLNFTFEIHIMIYMINP